MVNITLTAVASMCITLLSVFAAAKSRWIPWFNIVFGKQAYEHSHANLITDKDLDARCDNRQTSLDTKLERIFVGINSTNTKVDALKDQILAKLSDHGERIARLEGRSTHHRKDDEL